MNHTKAPSYIFFVRAVQGKKGEDKVAKKANETVDFIQQAQGGQPSVMQTMQVAMGVTLREGGGVKPGPKKVSTKEHMSRNDYMALVGRQVRVQVCENVVIIILDRRTLNKSLTLPQLR